MRNCIIYIIALLLVTLNLNAQHWHGTGSDTPLPPTTRLLHHSEQEIVVDFRLNGFYLDEVVTERGTQHLVTAPKMYATLEAGAPDLPHYPIPVIIGDLAEMKVSVSKSEFVDYQNIEIAPSKGNLSRQIDPDTVPYPYGAMYENDAFYPGEAAVLEMPYILRDFRGQNIMVTPFAYNPATKTLRVYTNLIISMKKVSDEGKNPKLSRKAGPIKCDPEWRQAYCRRFINFEATKYNFIEDRGTMLVICPEPYMQAMQHFVDWKNQSGRPTRMVNLSAIGGNDENLIKAYIQDLYDSEGLTYILLVGDYADITPHSLGNNGSSDNWFGKLEGTDNYIEAFVGRFSVESIADVETHVNKVIHYERDILSNIAWADHGVGIGATDGAGVGHNGGELDWEHIDYIRDTLLHYTYSDITRRYKSVNNPTAADLSNDFNAGASIVNYCNHGSETSWSVCNYSNTHVNALTNDYRWPAIISTACLNGKFNHSQPCFAEAWMRATNNETGAPTGAIGGMFAWPTQAWAPPMTGQDEMNAILAEWRDSDTYNHTMGGTFLNGNMKILDAHPADAGITHNTWILFGDPSLMLRTANPSSMNVHYSPDIFMQGVSSLLVDADTHYGIATLSRDGEVIATADVHNGSAELHFEPITGMGSVRLTVIGFNKETYVRDIDIASLEGPYVMLDEVSIDDPDGQLDYDQTAGLDITVKNVGVAAASNVSITLISNSEHVIVVNGSATLDAIGVGEHHSIEDVFTIKIANNVPNATRAPMRLQCSDGDEVWGSDFKLTINAPVIELPEAYTIGDIAPGQSGTLKVIIKNSGDSPTPAGRLELFCGSGAIIFNNAVTFPSIAAAQTYELDIPFNVSGDATLGSAYEVDFYATAGMYHATGKTIIGVGDIKEDFETGDFTKFNWMFSGGDWTISTEAVHSGNYSARSAQISNNHSCDMITSVNVEASSEISFWVRTSSEPNCDKLHFYIDNDEIGVWSGISQDWEKATFPISAGFHLLRWVYSKDASSSYGEDCVWVDDIQFPPTSVETSLPSIQNLEAQVNGNHVSLCWQAMDGFQYLVRRNGVQIAQQSGNSYEETLADGIYSYCVIATDGQGHYSEPSCLTVEVGLLDIEDETAECSVYPNPVSGTLYIESNMEHLSFALYNAMGQQVIRGETAGTHQINVSNLPKGLYFLQLCGERWSSVRKIVVE